MPRAKQLTLSVPDRPGMLGQIATALGEKKVNITGMSAGVMEGRGMIWLVVDKTAAAKKVFAQHGWDAKEDEVLAVTLADTPGSLGRYASKLGKAGINITFAYTGTAGSARKQTGFFGVSDLKAALKVRP
ncbi:MAG: ACT domain-containing protein [Chloroflexi bacterium]|nr:MAG: ACT domain-containing protein [Chloroflexota bacterium]TMF23711.1 MAG: ACT domain-containing protein [Chloroflexota bacterium]TMF99593.1 MAG: ACT domain-containing protein [Chloroflexota bacterium]